MTMRKGDPRYDVSPRRVLFAEKGTELRISPLLEGIRTLSGEKIQWYLASELRDRIRDAHVRVTVIDKLARKQYEVEPRQFEGRLLHRLPLIRTPYGDAYAELYLAEPADSSRVALTRAGTRVIEDLASLPGLDHAPWSSRYVQGLIDAPFLNLTPGTRSGIIQDERYAALVAALEPMEAHVKGLIEEQQRAEEEQASQQSLRAIQRAFHEALLALPREEYDWFDVQGRAHREGGPGKPNGDGAISASQVEAAVPGLVEPVARRRTATPVLRLRGAALRRRDLPGCEYHAAQRGAQVSERCRAIDRGGVFRRTSNSTGRFSKATDRFKASPIRRSSIGHPRFPASRGCGLRSLSERLPVRAEALVTITDSLEVAMSSAVVTTRGLPGYTFERAAGELWRCRFDAERNIIVVNSGHRDFVFATRNRALQLRYLVRLYVKELVLKNFGGLPADQLLERMIELSLYAEEKLKSG